MELNKDNLEKGKYYCGFWYDSPSGSVVVGSVVVKMNNSSLYHANPFVNREGGFRYGECLTGSGITFREATAEEIFWLETCIKEHRSIKKEHIDFSKMNVEPQYEVY